MTEFSDFQIRGESDVLSPTPPPSPPSRTGVKIAVVVLVLAALAAGAYFYMRRATPAPAQTTTVPTRDFTDAAVGRETPTVNLPALDMSDELVRQLVGQLSSHPRVAAWLATKGLVRNFTVVVQNIAEGRAPGSLLPRTLRPAGPFRVLTRGNETIADPRNFDRYDSLTAAVASVDAAGAARVYTTLKPLIQDAYGDLGFPDTPFDRTLQRAIAQLVATPTAAASARLAPKGIGYAYDDDRIEGLTGAQKQLLRFGPGNAPTIITKLRDIARALGFREPPSRP